MQDAEQGSAPELDGQGLRIAMVQARFNEGVTDALVAACRDELLALGVDTEDIDLVRVPGALEIPAAIVIAQNAASERGDGL